MLKYVFAESITENQQESERNVTLVLEHLLDAE